MPGNYGLGRVGAWRHLLGLNVTELTAVLHDLPGQMFRHFHIVVLLHLLADYSCVWDASVFFLQFLDGLFYGRHLLILQLLFGLGFSHLFWFVPCLANQVAHQLFSDSELPGHFFPRQMLNNVSFSDFVQFFQLQLGSAPGLIVPSWEAFLSGLHLDGRFRLAFRVI